MIMHLHIIASTALLWAFNHSTVKCTSGCGPHWFVKQNTVQHSAVILAHTDVGECVYVSVRWLDRNIRGVCGDGVDWFTCPWWVHGGWSPSPGRSRSVWGRRRGPARGPSHHRRSGNKKGATSSTGTDRFDHGEVKHWSLSTTCLPPPPTTPNHPARTWHALKTLIGVKTGPTAHQHNHTPTSAQVISEHQNKHTAAAGATLHSPHLQIRSHVPSARPSLFSRSEGSEESCSGPERGRSENQRGERRVCWLQVELAALLLAHCCCCCRCCCTCDAPPPGF